MKCKSTLLIPILLLTAVLLEGCSQSLPAFQSSSAEETAVEPASTLPETVHNTEAAAQPETTADTTPETAPEATTVMSDSSAQALLAQMDLRQKIGQLFFVTPDSLVEGTGDLTATRCTETMVQMLRDYPVGGIAMFADNICTRQQIIDFNVGLQEASRIPLFISVDEEGGTVTRLSSNKALKLPHHREAASISDFREAKQTGASIGAYMRDFGFNMNFAPVADVNTNPDNPVIGRRAFSSDPQQAAALSRAMADGLTDLGIIPVFKHFPGHGDTRQDSHETLAFTEKTARQMAKCEWIPFQGATDTDCIMIGHIAAPEITGNHVPATLSPEIVTGILQEQMGFRGLIVTDSLVMKAITNQYSSVDAALGALNAGCHMLLLPENVKGTFDQLVEAVETGVFSIEKLDSIVLHILQFKQLHGLL